MVGPTAAVASMSSWDECQLSALLWECPGLSQVYTSNAQILNVHGALHFRFLS